MNFDAFVSAHPILTLFLYVLFCIALGVGIFFSFSALRKKIEIKRNMKRRVANDKSR